VVRWGPFDVPRISDWPVLRGRPGWRTRAGLLDSCDSRAITDCAAGHGLVTHEVKRTLANLNEPSRYKRTHALKAASLHESH
jgi:hypothetical protein